MIKVRLSNSGSGLRKVAYVYRPGDPPKWVPVITFIPGGPSDYAVNTDVTPEELAAVTLAVACETNRTASGEFDAPLQEESLGGP